uniref:Tyrosine specific protein phosphatases domain-containing protein n=1 Tax=Arcella intermedia TaxID=1963864 RepID=A0A6B2LRV0_9EUKA
MVVPVDDYGSSDLNAIAAKCLPFIKQVKDSGGKVVVHCSQGINRSCTVVLLYLLCEEKYSLLDAWNLLKSAHPKASPHELYWEKLRNIELQKTGEITLTKEILGPTMQDWLRSQASNHQQ